MPLQCARDAVVGPFMAKIRGPQFRMDDFGRNGILLPTLASQSMAAGLPLHFGGHPNYNSKAIAEINAIRVFCESVRAESRRLELALAGMRALQRRIREAIVNHGAGHVDRVVLAGRTDGDLDALIDRLFAERQS
jgi:hypothetical protein